MRKQPFLERRKPEKVILLADELGRAAANVAVGKFGTVGNVALVENTVATFVPFLIDHIPHFDYLAALRAIRRRATMFQIAVALGAIRNTIFLRLADHPLHGLHVIGILGSMDEQTFYGWRRSAIFLLAG